MTRIGIIGSRRQRRDGAVCEWVYGLTRQCTDAQFEGVDLLRRRAAARGRGICASHRSLRGAAFTGEADRVASFDAFMIATGGQRLGVRRSEGPDRIPCPRCGPTRLPVVSPLRQRGGLVQPVPVPQGQSISPPAPSVRTRVDQPTRRRRAVVVDGEDVLVPARDVVTLARVDERGGRCR
jgi:hypothetical protein